MKSHLLFIMLFCYPIIINAQEVYQDLTNQGIYDFMDELANLKIITLTSVIRPYSRSFIAQKLNEALMAENLLNHRQKKELAFYLKDYNLELKSNLTYFKTPKGLFRKKEKFGIPISPLSFIYKDSLFTFSLRPVWGIVYFKGKDNSSYHRWGGAEIFGSVGKHFGFYASLRDNHESSMMVNDTAFTLDEGAAWKAYGKSGDYSEMRGGITFTWNWGSVCIAKDHFQWGDNYHGSNILSGRTPSFPYFQLHMKPLKWLNYTFVTGWLISEVIDSSRSYLIPAGIREYNFNKFISAAMITVSPWKNLDISVGNSVISCSKNYNPAYLSPFLFYVNFTSTGNSFEKTYYGRNSQFFANISTRQVRHLHLYGSLFIDDLGFTRFPEGAYYTCISWKAGFRLSNLFNQNLSLTAECTRTTPRTYTYPVSTLTFYSNNYSLGNYLGDNSEELFASLGYRPLRGLMVNVSYCLAEHGNAGDTRTLKTFLWGDQVWKLDLSYEIINNAYIFLGFQNHFITGDKKFSPLIFRANGNIISGGFNVGF